MRYLKENEKGKKHIWEFPVCPLVWTQCCYCQALSSVCGQRTKIPQAKWHGQKKEKKVKR